MKKQGRPARADISLGSIKRLCPPPASGVLRGSADHALSAHAVRFVPYTHTTTFHGIGNSYARYRPNQQLTASSCCVPASLPQDASQQQLTWCGLYSITSRPHNMTCMKLFCAGISPHMCLKCSLMHATCQSHLARYAVVSGCLRALGLLVETLVAKTLAFSFFGSGGHCRPVRVYKGCIHLAPSG